MDPKKEKISEPTPEEGSSWFQILAIFAASLSGMTMGALFAWPSPSIPKIADDDTTYPDINFEEASYFTVMSPIGTIIACPLYAKLNDIIGRKFTLLSIAIPHITAWILIATARSVYVFYVARLLAGAGDACMFAALPIYIGEVATPKIRGTWGNAMTFLIYTGQFFINAVGSYNGIDVTAYISLSITVVFVSVFSFMPETPYYCVMKNKFEDAEKALQKLLRKRNVDEELEKLKSDVARQISEKGTWRDLFTIKTNQRALIAGLFLRITQMLSGFAALAQYTEYIFSVAGSDFSPTVSTLIYSGLCSSLNLLGSVTVDMLGRRKSYILSNFFGGVALAIESVYFLIDKFFPDVDLEVVSWIPVAGMIIFMVSFSIGIGIVPTLMAGELFSASIKGKGTMLLNIAYAAFMSVTTKLFQVLDNQVGLFCPFALFAAFCFLTSIGTVFLVPETKGKTLEEIQQDLRDGNIRGNKKKNNIGL